MRRRLRPESGLTLIELIVAFTILMLLTTLALPMAKHKLRKEKERDLRIALHDIRAAIDKYKDMKDAGKLGQLELGTEGYPKTLEVLVEGEKMSGQVEGKMRFLRRLPKDPMTNSYDWGKRSLTDDPKSGSSWGGQNVFDVYTKSTDKASDGTPYSEW
jgi:general secretion pathway protein G